jgi:hypothetical protein
MHGYLITITEPLPLTVTTVSNNQSVTATGSGGTPPYLYSIDNGRTFTANATFNNLAPKLPCFYQRL